MKTEKDAKIIHIYNPKIQTRKFVKFPDTKDSFIKESKNMTKELECNNFVQSMSFYKLDHVSNKLIEKGHWSDGINMVSFNTTDGKISSVSVCASPNGFPTNNVKQISVDNFIDLYTHLTAHHIKKNPTMETEYKEIFTNMISYLNKNKFVE